ncbi:MAG: hypothetical protein IRZ16_17045 [Myxococcaceae bacterium]|nr:hypothetical protein [Myxococcaceae bacterium]
MRRLLLSALSVSLTLTAFGCQKNEADSGPKPPPVTSKKPVHAAEPPKLNRVPRADFNRLAAELDLPIFWTRDANQDGAISPDELAVYWGAVPNASRDDYVSRGAFTPKFTTAYEEIAKRYQTPPTFGDDDEGQRQKLVLEELAQSRPTLIETDLTHASEGEKRFVSDILKAAVLAESLYQQQMGMAGFDSRIPPDDAASRMMFFRNQSFHCTAPKTQGNPKCSAIPNPPTEKLSGLYPSGPLQDPGFCESLQKNKDESLTDPFTVVKEGEGGKLEAVPYNNVWPKEMTAISNLLKDAAQAFPEGEEPALKAYLNAAAQAFLDNDWAPADEAWAKMSSTNSKWYLRIGPDEVYDEPCSTKALFHTSFARIDQGSLKWQNLLDPLKNEMEQEVATLAGKPYKPRKVSFHLPDFIEIVVNSGDSRSPSGATIGQSLPNFGAVANEGRGRTVAMTNIGTDPDSREVQEATGKSLLCSSVMPRFTTDPEPQLMSTVLHEAAHNLGPAHQYKVNGKIDREQFGGPLASMMEELKAQTAALYYADWLAAKKLITPEQAGRAHVRDLTWIFGHISRGMYDEQHHPRTYSQLAAIQLAMLLDAGAISWHPDEVAANGKDKGCFAFDLPKWPETTKAMLKTVAGIKARGDRKEAERLVADDVDVTGDLKHLHEVITERVLRAPKASYVYAIEL